MQAMQVASVLAVPTVYPYPAEQVRHAVQANGPFENVPEGHGEQPLPVGAEPASQLNLVEPTVPDETLPAESTAQRRKA